MAQSLDRIILSSKRDKYFSEQRLVCEAYDCNKRATKQVTMNAGNLGDIELNLCKKCVPKFSSTAVKNGNTIQLSSVNDKKRCFNNEYSETVL